MRQAKPVNESKIKKAPGGNLGAFWLKFVLRLAVCCNHSVIRLATPEDVLRIAEIHVTSWRSAYRGILPQKLLESLTVKSRESLWLGLCGKEAAPVFVVEEENNVLGFCHVCRSRDTDLTNTAEITCIYVSPGKERQGLGRQLMGTAEGFAKVKGYSAISLWVLVENLQSRQFYEVLGFHPDGATKEEKFAGCSFREMRYVRSL